MEKVRGGGSVASLENLRVAAWLRVSVKVRGYTRFLGAHDGPAAGCDE